MAILSGLAVFGAMLIIGGIWSRILFPIGMIMLGLSLCTFCTLSIFAAPKPVYEPPLPQSLHVVEEVDDEEGVEIEGPEALYLKSRALLAEEESAA